MTSITITLPYPPSANTYWRKWRNRMVLTDKGRAYKDTVAKLARSCGLYIFPAGRLAMTIEAYLPDARVRDMDNIQKATMDALKGCAYVDDKQVRDLRTVDMGIDRVNPRVEVTITPTQEADSDE